MADNVNIIVQDTINDIVVNAAVVVETIDINVQAAVDEVQIIANPNNYVVNINRIIGEQVQSDWDQTDNQAPDYIKNKPTIPTATSDLTNDGSDGINPFITAADIPPVTGFVPYTGATANVDLGEFEIKAGQVTLDTSPTGTAAVATTRWNDSIGSTETTLKGGSVVLKNGVDLVARVVNKVTPNTTLTKAAYQAVRISGAQGQRLAVAYAQANNDNNSADTIGIVCETIATNQEGFILTVGQLEEINTTGSLQGETWADGDVLYLSPTTAGRLTNIKPTGATGHIVVMGYVEYSHAVHGKIYVKIMNGWELDELHNVSITSPANNEGLFYDSADSLWKNETIASALGYTPVTNARTISTIAPLSGGGDLTANRTLSITQASTSTDGYLSSTNWNTFNNKADDSLVVHLAGTETITGKKTFNPSVTASAALAQGTIFTPTLTAAANSDVLVGLEINPTFTLGAFTGTNSVGLTIRKGKLQVLNGWTGNNPNTDVACFGNPVLAQNQFISVDSLAGNQAGVIFRSQLSTRWTQYRDATNSNMNFLSASTGTSALALFYSTANVGIGTSTDAGFKLDVNGTARVRTSSGSYVAALTVENTGTASVDFKNVAMFMGARGNSADPDDNTNIGIWQKNNTVNNYGIVNFFNTAGNLSSFFGCQYVSHGASPTGNLIFGTVNASIKSEKMRIFANGNVAINTTTDISSAILNITSTTKGFLPPRMTNAQRLAIASPAVGLMVYCTDAVEGLYVNKSTGWTFVI